MRAVRPQLRVAALFAVMALGACATLPDGPSVPVLPGTGKSFDRFRVDDALCRQYAYEQVGGVSAQETANRSGVQSAVVGTAIGAAAGAAFGGGQGAAIGAGTGLLFGSAVGTSAASNTYASLQQRYDNGYIQCMFARGNRVPVFGQFASPVPWAPSPLPGYALPPRVAIPPPNAAIPPPNAPPPRLP